MSTDPRGLASPIEQKALEINLNPAIYGTISIRPSSPSLDLWHPAIRQQGLRSFATSEPREDIVEI